ncbi:sulfotransferase family 2 domain-containing protein [Thiocapsa sp.]|uniref:sulfotransferase family 2 domain-containing protein n=1 Tax=Thiocapsa sp. TaxID=2024551 RepID=UPI002C4020D3|nr:sulfotransferase family 2 domain-containing protein [Thiocapsa sp.]HSO81671.1 sulfotransferase family 2 domain-containing protein [Thiocapsa sp.]
MIISNSNRFIFIHLHKCAGSTITNLLSPHSRWNDIELGVTTLGEAVQRPYQQRFRLWKHAGADLVRGVLGEKLFGSYFKFAFVRNPLIRVVSFYTFIQKLHRHPSEQVRNMVGQWPISEALRDSADFPEFIRHPRFVEPSMSRLLTESADPDARVLVDFVGHVERFDHDIATVFDRIGLPLPERIDRMNESGQIGQRLRDFYRSEEDLEVVYRRWPKDFDLFGYSLEDSIAELRRPDDTPEERAVHADPSTTEGSASDSTPPSRDAPISEEA